jgi:hypothetical protein
MLKHCLCWVSSKLTTEFNYPIFIHWRKGHQLIELINNIHHFSSAFRNNNNYNLAFSLSSTITEQLQSELQLVLNALEQALLQRVFSIHPVS